MMTELNSPTVRSAVRTHGDSKEDVSSPSINRWTDHGRDRLYLNGLFAKTTDAYVDLNEMSVSGVRKRSATVEWDDDELVVRIERASWNYEVVIGNRETDGTDDTTTDEADDEKDDGSGVDLEQFGVDI